MSCSERVKVIMWIHLSIVDALLCMTVFIIDRFPSALEIFNSWLCSGHFNKVSLSLAAWGVCDRKAMVFILLLPLCPAVTAFILVYITFFHHGSFICSLDNKLSLVHKLSPLTKFKRKFKKEREKKVKKGLKKCT